MLSLPERLMTKGYCFGRLEYYPYYPIFFWPGEGNLIIVGKVGEIVYQTRKVIPLPRFFDAIKDIYIIKLEEITFKEIRRSSYEILNKHIDNMVMGKNYLTSNSRVDKFIGKTRRTRKSYYS